MIKVVLLTVLLATTVAQIFPSCGGPGKTVIGWVQKKLFLTQKPEPHIIVINYIEYGVPYEFWIDVEVGDLVKLENGVWTIVKKAGT